MSFILLAMKGLPEVEQAQDKSGPLFEHWFASGGPFMVDLSGAAHGAAGPRRVALKTIRFSAAPLLASNPMTVA